AFASEMVERAELSVIVHAHVPLIAAHEGARQQERRATGEPQYRRGRELLGDAQHRSVVGLDHVFESEELSAGLLADEASLFEFGEQLILRARFRASEWGGEQEGEHNRAS